MFALLHGILQSQSGPPFGFTFSRRTTTDTPMGGPYIPGEPIAESQTSLGKVFFDVSTFGDTSSITLYGIVSGDTSQPVIENETWVEITPGVGVTYSIAAGNKYYRAFGYNGVEYFYSTDEVQFQNIKITTNYTFIPGVWQYDPIDVYLEATFVNYVAYTSGFYVIVSYMGATEIESDPYYNLLSATNYPSTSTMDGIYDSIFAASFEVYSPFGDQSIWIRPYVDIGGIRYWGELYQSSI